MAKKTIIGVDVGGTNARAGAVRGQELGEVVSTPVRSDGSAEEVLDQISGLIEQAMREEPSIGGVGIGVPGVVDVGSGTVYDLVNIPSWKEVPLKSILEERFSVPVLVNNDANCFALGEHHFARGRGHRSMIGLIVGTGFAGGVIINGRLYTGRNCGAGEFGMIRYLDSIQEHYSAGQFFPRRVGQTAAEVHERALAGDPEAVGILAEFGHHVGEGIKTILYAYDPEIIILGGGVRKAFGFFRDTMWESIRSFTFSNSIRSLKIEVSELEHVAVLGAAALHYDAELAAVG